MASGNVGAGYHFKGEHVYDGMCLIPVITKENIEAVKGFEFRDSDVLVATYPKSGTTWLQEIVYLIHNEANTTLAKQKSILQRFPYIEVNINKRAIMEAIDQSTPPRMYKTHLPFPYFKAPMDTKKMKAIYVVRNPKDMLVSLYYFYISNDLFGPYPGDWDSFFELFKTGRIFYGDWFEHVDSWWQQRHLSNVFFIKYEDLKRDLLKSVREIAEFCEVQLTEGQLRVIVSHCSFSEMRNNSSVNYSTFLPMDQSISKFMRKGEVGDWQKYFTADQSTYVDNKYQDKLGKVGLNIEYTI